MRISANRISIEIDDQGPAGAPPVLLIMGLGMQLVAWPEPFVRMLVDRGLRVIRLDNRDAGLSQGFDDRGVPNLAWQGLRHAMRLPVQAPYSLDDMAGDALGVLSRATRACTTRQCAGWPYGSRRISKFQRRKVTKFMLCFRCYGLGPLRLYIIRLAY